MKKQKKLSKRIATQLWLHRRRLGWFTVLFVGLVAIQLSYNWHAGHVKLLGYSTRINQEELSNYTNEQRTQNGLSKLTLNPQLSSAAQATAEYMVKHQTTQPNDKLQYFLAQTHYKQKVNESIAYGFTNSSEIITAWSQNKNNKALLNSQKDVGYGIIHTANYQGVETTLVVALYSQSDQAAATAPSQIIQEIRGLPLVTGGGAPWAVYASLALLGSVALGFIMAHLELFRLGLYRSKRALLAHPSFDTVVLALLSYSLLYAPGGFIK